MSHHHRFINCPWKRNKKKPHHSNSAHGQKSDFKKQVSKGSSNHPTEVKPQRKTENIPPLQSSGVLNKGY